MFEFALRSVCALGLAATSWLLPAEMAEWGWRMGALWGTVGLFAFLLDRRGLRSVAVSSGLALIDGAMLAVLLARVGASQSLAPVVWLPVAYAVRFHQVGLPWIAPITLATWVSSENMLGKGAFTPEGLGLVLAGLAATLLATPGRVETMRGRNLADEEEEDDRESILPQAFDFRRQGAFEDAPSTSALVELKENYRKLREHAQTTEQRARRSGWGFQLLETGLKSSPGTMMSALAANLQEISGASSLTLYAVNPHIQSLIVQAAVGDSVASSSTRRIPIGRETQEMVLRERVLRTLDAEDRARPGAMVWIRSKYKWLGLVWLTTSQPEMLDAAREAVEACSETLGLLLSWDQERHALKSRSAEMAWRYEVSMTAHGADTPRTLISRLIHGLFEDPRVDHLSGHLLDGDDMFPICSEGDNLRLLDAMSFAKGEGIAGWLALGAPDLRIWDTSEDPRCPRDVVLKRRVGSMVAVCVRVQGEPYAVLVAGSHRAGAVDERTAEMLMLIGGELGRAIERLENPDAMTLRGGWLTPEEFQQTLREESGCLIVLDVLRKTELRAEYGADVMDAVLRPYGQRVRSLSPSDAKICRHADSLLVFLPQAEEAFARSWANEMAALAAMSDLRLPGSDRRVPLAVRAKVSSYHPGFLSESDRQIASSDEEPALLLGSGHEENS